MACLFESLSAVNVLLETMMIDIAFTIKCICVL